MQGRSVEELLELHSSIRNDLSKYDWVELLTQLSYQSPLPVLSSPRFLPILRDLEFLIESDFFPPRQLAITLHRLAAMSSVQVKHFETLDNPRIAELLLDRVADRSDPYFTVRDLSSIMYAAGMLPRGSVRALTSEVEKRGRMVVGAAVETDDRQSVGMIARSLAVLGVESPRFFGSIDKKAGWLLCLGRPNSAYVPLQSGVDVFWAASYLGYSVPKLAVAVDKRSRDLVNRGTSREISSTAIAYARLSWKPKHFWKELYSGSNYERLLGKNSEVRHAVHVIWSTKISGIDEDPKVRNGLRKLWAKVSMRGGVEEGVLAKQMGHAGIVEMARGEALGTTGVDLIAGMLTEFSSGGEEQTLNRSVQEGLWWQAVRSAGDELGLSEDGWFREANPYGKDGEEIFGTMLAIDFAYPERKIAVEYDGPYHFLKNVAKIKSEGGFELKSAYSMHRKGPTVSKRQMMKDLGWTVVELTFFDEGEIKEKCEGKSSLMGQMRKDIVKARLEEALKSLENL